MRSLESTRTCGNFMFAGAIDGTHIPIIAPVIDHADYVNRKGSHSLVMKAVVDSKYLFRDVDVGWLGGRAASTTLAFFFLFRAIQEGKSSYPS